MDHQDDCLPFSVPPYLRQWENCWMKAALMMLVSVTCGDVVVRTLRKLEFDAQRADGARRGPGVEITCGRW